MILLAPTFRSLTRLGSMSLLLAPSLFAQGATRPGASAGGTHEVPSPPPVLFECPIYETARFANGVASGDVDGDLDVVTPDPLRNQVSFHRNAFL